MKKIILCFLLITILSNCEIKFKEVNAQINKNQKEYISYPVESSVLNSIGLRRIDIDSMEFVMVTGQGGNWNLPTTIINLTKEKLEVELLKKQLKK